jgi:TP901 family phage tail tape measure protein
MAATAELSLVVTADAGNVEASLKALSGSIDKLVTGLTSIGTKSRESTDPLRSVSASFDGAKLASAAMAAAKGVESIGGVSKLTNSELLKVQKTVEMAVEKFNVLGKDIPPEIQKLATSLEAVTKASRDVAESSAEAATKAANLAKAGTEMQSGLGGIAKVGAGIFAPMAAGALALAGGIGVASVKAAEFGTVVGQIDTLGAVTGAQLQELKAGILDVSAHLGEDPVVAANAVYDALSSGIPPNNVLSFMETAGKAAVAGASDTGTAVTALAGTVNAWGLNAAESAKISDAMFAGVGVGVFNFGELASSIGTVSSIAAAMGVSYQEVIGATATMTLSNMTASQAMTAQRAAIVSLITPNKDMASVLDVVASKNAEVAAYAAKNGTSMGEAALKTLGLHGALNAVNDAATSSGVVMAKAAGSTEALSAFLNLTGDNADAAAGHLKTVQDSAGAAAGAFDKMAETPAQKMKVFRASVEATVIKIGDGFLPILGSVLDAVTPLIPVIGQLATSFGGQLAGAIESVKPFVMPVVALLGNLFMLVAKNANWIAPLVAAAGAAAAIGALMVPVGTLITAITAAFAAASGPVAVLTAAFPILGGAIGALLGPIGWTALAIAGLYIAFKNNVGGLRDIVVGGIQGVIGGFKALWSSLVSMDFSGIIGSVGSIFQSLPRLLLSPITAMINIFAGFFPNVGAKLQAGWSTIVANMSAQFGQLGQIIGGYVSAALALVTGNFAALPSILAETAQSVLMFLTAPFRAMLTTVGSLLGVDLLGIVQGGITTVQTWLAGAWASVVSIFGTARDAVVGAFSGIGEWIASAFSGVVGFFVGLWASVGETFAGVRDTVVGALASTVEAVKSWATEHQGAITAIVGFLALLTAPLWLPVVIVVEVAKYFREHWDQIAADTLALVEKVKTFFTDMGQKVRALVDGLVTWVTGLFAKQTEQVTVQTELLSATVTSIWDMLTLWLSETVDSLVDWMVERWTGFKTWMANLWTNVGNIFVKAWAWIVQKVSGAASAIMRWLSNAWNGLGKWLANFWNSVGTLIAKAWQWIKDSAIGKAVTKIVNAVSKAFAWLGGILADIWDNIVSLVSRAWSYIYGTFQRVGAPIVQGVANTFATVVEVIGNALSDGAGIVSRIMGKIAELLSPLGALIGGETGGLIEKMKSGAAGALDSVKGFISGTISKIKGFGSKAKSLFGDFVDGSKDKLKGLFKFDFGSLTDQFAGGDAGGPGFGFGGAGFDPGAGPSVDAGGGGGGGGGAGGEEGGKAKKEKKEKVKKERKAREKSARDSEKEGKDAEDAAVKIAEIASKVAGAIQDGLDALTELGAASLPSRELWGAKLTELQFFIESAIRAFEDVARSTLKSLGKSIDDAADLLNANPLEGINLLTEALDGVLGTMSTAVDTATSVSEFEPPSEETFAGVSLFISHVRDQGLALSKDLKKETLEVFGGLATGLKGWVENFALAASAATAIGDVKPGVFEAAASRATDFLFQIKSFADGFVADLQKTIPLDQQKAAVDLSGDIANSFGSWVDLLNGLGAAASNLARIVRIPADIDVPIKLALNGIANVAAVFLAGLQKAYTDVKSATGVLDLSSSIATTFGVWLKLVEGLGQAAANLRKIKTVPPTIGDQIKAALLPIALAAAVFLEGMQVAYAETEDAQEVLGLSSSIAQTFQVWVGLTGQIADLGDRLSESKPIPAGAIQQVEATLHSLSAMAGSLVVGLDKSGKEIFNLLRDAERTKADLDVVSDVMAVLGEAIKLVGDSAGLGDLTKKVKPIDQAGLDRLLAGAKSVQAAVQEYARIWVEANPDAVAVQEDIAIFASATKNAVELLRGVTGLKLADQTALLQSDIDQALTNATLVRERVAVLANEWAKAHEEDAGELIQALTAYKAATGAALDLLKSASGVKLAEPVALVEADIDLALENAAKARRAIEKLATEWFNAREEVDDLQAAVAAYVSVTKGAVDLLASAAKLEMGKQTAVLESDLRLALINAEMIRIFVQDQAAVWAGASKDMAETKAQVEAYTATAKAALDLLKASGELALGKQTALVAGDMATALSNAELVRFSVEAIAHEWARTAGDTAVVAAAVKDYVTVAGEAVKLVLDAAALNLDEAHAITVDQLGVALDNVTLIQHDVEALALGWAAIHDDTEKASAEITAYAAAAGESVKLIKDAAGLDLAGVTHVTVGAVQLALHNAEIARIEVEKLALAWATNEAEAARMAEHVKAYAEAAGGAVKLVGDTVKAFEGLSKIKGGGENEAGIKAAGTLIKSTVAELNKVFDELAADGVHLANVNQLVSSAAPAAEAISKVLDAFSLDRLLKNPLARIKATGKRGETFRQNIANNLRDSVQKLTIALIDGLKGITVPEGLGGGLDRLANLYDRLLGILERLQDVKIDLSKVSSLAKAAQILGATGALGGIGGDSSSAEPPPYEPPVPEAAGEENSTVYAPEVTVGTLIPAADMPPMEVPIIPIIPPDLPPIHVPIIPEPRPGGTTTGGGSTDGTSTGDHTYNQNAPIYILDPDKAPKQLLDALSGATGNP